MPASAIAGSSTPKKTVALAVAPEVGDQRVVGVEDQGGVLPAATTPAQRSAIASSSP